MVHQLRFALAVLLTFATAGPALAADFDRAAWIADFDQLQAAITRTSPNLEWAHQRGLDLPALEARARTRLAVARDEAAARSALERFVRNFGDGHMELRWPSAASPQPALAGLSAPRSTCAELGYRTEPDTAAVASRLPGYQSLTAPDAQVGAGTVLSAGRTVGVLRIAIFSPSVDQCLAALASKGQTPEAPCNESCAEAVTRRADTLFIQELEAALRMVANRRPDALLIDVAGNGGGDDSAIALVRMLGAADAPTPPMALVRGPATARDLAEDEAKLQAALANASAAETSFLRPLIAAHAAARFEASRPCDLAPLWRGAAPECSQLVRGPFYAGGLVARDLPTAFSAAPWAEHVSSVARFRYTSNLWRGPLLVLVDGNSASSTELFGAMLQDARRAVLVGAPTFGAGCGWVRTPEPVVLKASGGVLTVPDCARFRLDGRNELDGLQPDVLVGFRTYDSPRQRVARLLSQLPTALEQALALRP